MKKHAFIGGGGGNLWIHYQAWLKELGLEQQVAMHHATSGGLLSAIRSGIGIAVLPCIVPTAIRISSAAFRRGPTRTAVWLFTHERGRHTPRVRAVIDFLYERLSAHVRQLKDKRAAA